MTESPDWHRFDLAAELRARYSSVALHSIHDAKAAGLAVWRGLALPSGARVLLYVSAGQGDRLGPGCRWPSLSRQPWPRRRTRPHLDRVNGPLWKCGNHGCLELFTSRIALLREVRKHAEGHTETRLTPDARFAGVVAAYGAGDNLTVAEIDRVARHLAQGIINCINVVKPDLVVIGDEYAELGAPFLRAVDAHIRASLLPNIYRSIRLELSETEGDLVLKGAFLDVLSQTYLTAPREEAKSARAVGGGT